MSVNPDSVGLPTMFQVAYAPTVKSKSTNRTFNIKTLGDMLMSEQSVPQATVDAMRPNYETARALNNAVKVMRPIIHPGQFPDGISKRTTETCEGITALIHDYDGYAGDRITMTTVIERCIELGVEVICWETFSAEDDGYTFRALFPLATVLAADCGGAAHIELKNLLGFGPATTFGPHQGYFITPRPGRKPVVRAVRGKPVDVMLDFFLLESTADAVAPQGGFQTQTDYDVLDHALSLDEKELYWRCMTVINSHGGERNHWIAMIGAGLRGWGFTPQILTNPELQNESHRAQLVRLDEWSKSERIPEGGKATYSPGCVVEQGRKLFATGAKMAGLTAIVQQAHADSPDGIVELLDDPELKRIAMLRLNQKPESTNTITFEELAAATTERQAKREREMLLADRQMMAIHNMPACFGRVRDWCVEFASKGEMARHIQLTDDYRFPIDPISAILSIAQLLSVVAGGRVWVNQGSVYPPTQLNLYVLRIAGSGTGKSISLSWLKGCMSHTVFKHSLVSNMSFSIGGFWPHTFERIGPNVLQLTDEGANLIANHIGNNGSNLKTLHTALLSAYSAGHEGGELDAPIYSTGGKRGAKQDNNFEAVIEPNLNIQAIGTHDLLPQMNDPEFLQSGFSARFITRIEPKQAEITDEDVLAQEMESCFDENSPEAKLSLSLSLEAQRKFSEHFVEFDRELEQVDRGTSISDTLAIEQFESDGAIEITPAIYKAAIVGRQSAARTNQYIRKNIACGQVMAEARLFFTPYVHDNELLEAVRHREVEKLTKLSAIYTLGRNPDSQFIDADIARYLMGILQMAQLDFISLEQTRACAPPRWTSQIKMLERETKPGGKLYEAGEDGVTMVKLRDCNRAWRELIADLKLDDDDLKGPRQQAKQVLHDLGVIEKKVGKATVYFLVK